MWSNKEADFSPEINKSFIFHGMGLQASWSKLSEYLKNVSLTFIRPRGSWIVDQNNIFNVLINNWRSAVQTKMLIPFMIFSDNLL